MLSYYAKCHTAKCDQENDNANGSVLDGIYHICRLFCFRSFCWLVFMEAMTAEHIDSSITRALAGESRLDPAALNILGFATPTMRHLFNNLCRIEGLTYLECGTYTGASLISAFNNNPIQAIGIDNFSQTWAPGRDIRGEFLENLKIFRDTAKSVLFFQDDCFRPDLLIGLLIGFRGIDIFFYDGDHTKEAQAKALPHFFDLLAPVFLFIVDDFCWESVALGTAEGFAALGSRLMIQKKWELIGEVRLDDPVYHNGLCLFLCKKI